MDTPRRPDSLAPMYSPRNGVGVEAEIRELFTAPEHRLSPEDTEEIIEYGYELLEGQTDTAQCEAKEDLETIHRTPATTAEQTFYLRYFLTPQGQVDLQSLGIREIGSFKGGKDQLSNIEHVMAAASKKTRKEAAARSLKWYKAELADRLLQHPRTDQFYTDEEVVTVNYEPEKLLTKLEGLQAYRRFYNGQVRGLRAQPDSPLRAAKLDLLAIYKGRLNNIVADLYPNAFNLARQLYDQGGSDELKDRLKTTVPVVGHLFEHKPVWERDKLVDEFAQRLDLVRSGADWAQTSEGFISTPVSSEVRGLVEDLKTKSEQITTEPLLPQDAIEELKHVTWNAEQVKELNEAVLHKWGMHSAYAATWSEVQERKGPAPDGLFQVVITPEKDSLSIDSARFVMYIPASFNRGLMDTTPAGVLPLSAHELEHCVQAMFDRKAGENIPIARIKGRRYVTMREAGGVYNETRLLKRYFGINSETNVHYLRALDAKLQGGNKMQVIRAFYESLRSSSQEQPWSQEQEAKMRSMAVDRTLRLYRNSGHNSQPLDYVEQALIVNALQSLSETQISAFLTAAGSLNTSDTVVLHRLGLVKIEHAVDINVVDDVMQVFLDQFADKHLA